MYLLHGELELKIVEARLELDMEYFSEHGHHYLQYPYVKAYMGPARVARTNCASAESCNPVWNHLCKLPVAYSVYQVRFKVKDSGMFRDKLIGFATVPAKRIAAGEVIDEWFSVRGSKGKPLKADIAIRLQITFTPCHKNPTYLSGITNNYGLKESYFLWRHGGKLTLYQDAHVIDGMVPEIKLEGGRDFEHNKCWEDICHAILEAHHLVYIVGWSIFHKVKLVREPTTTRPLPNGGDLNLGELLKYKSEEGVKVVLLVWDDKTSHNKFFIKTGGIMKTHDKETREFFKHSSVTCVLAPRYTHFKQQVFRIWFSHHQKCVIADVKFHGDRRKIAAFIGGLDLCGGRYDTPGHRLYNDLDTVFKDDNYNPAFSQGNKGPRQPWHDLHCRIEGPAAFDVLKNFEQRWEKAIECSESGRLCKRLLYYHNDALLDIEHNSSIVSPSATVPIDHPSLWVSKENDPENWHIQIFRSVDSTSLAGFPDNILEANEQNLVYEDNMVIDRSIQMAYIQAIRSAHHFIYIENQYFIGSSFAWPHYRKAGAHNLIPMELALKIASKIRAKERFSVYVVIPMWPEGKPDSPSVQEILNWQGQTMRMMYGVIAQELKSAQLENAHPTDYLNFYCLGKREGHHKEESSSEARDSASETFGRFMIYVHSKGMVVDDEYVIIGSANINQRSMAGSRDTEIAMGGYQPHYTWANKKEHPCGQIYGYRVSLWAEHLGRVESCFKDPETMSCVKYVNAVAEENWNRYIADKFSPLQGNILKYPLEIDCDGHVSPLPGNETFPDFEGGRVLGRKYLFPRKLTT